jgi:hypothetical protein
MRRTDWRATATAAAWQDMVVVLWRKARASARSVTRRIPGRRVDVEGRGGVDEWGVCALGRKALPRGGKGAEHSSGFEWLMRIECD